VADKRLRELEREAELAPDDVQAQAALLRERMRCGELPARLLELAAYCSAPGALGAVGYGERVRPGWPDIITAPAVKFTDWTKGLERWGPRAEARAAVAASRVALPVWQDRHGADWERSPDHEYPRRAIEAAERWLEHPSLPHHMEWNAVHAGPGTPAQPMFVVRPWDARTGQLGLRIEASAYLAGEQLVREAISTALIAWALGGSRG